MQIRRYKPEDSSDWNGFLVTCKNSHFMFNRNYMDYHQHRFMDHSLMLYDGSILVALLPANMYDNKLYTHQGLSFGGFLVNTDMRTETMLIIFGEVRRYLKSLGVGKLVYKCIPHIYHASPAEEDLYALFRHDAALIRRDVSSAIDLTNRPHYNRLRVRCVKKAVKSGVAVARSHEPSAFWKILEGVLHNQHDAAPVHSLDEMQLLMSRFPDNIKLYTAELDGETVAGCLVYETNQTAHTQYLASNSKGRDAGALDLVIDYLISEVYKGKRYFDFGISNEQSGRYLNSGLIAHKEGFGARAVTHDFYEMNFL